MIKTLFIVVISMLATNAYSASNTGNFFEPYLGVNFSSFTEEVTKVNGTSNGRTFNNYSSTVKGDFSGPAFGLRLYKKFLDQFILGADGTLGIATGELNLGLASMGKYSLVSFSPGLIVGWDIPTILLPRVWAGFYPINSLSLTKEGETKGDSFSGYSTKFGLSFDWWIQLGLEMSNHKYSQVNGNKLPDTETSNGLTMTMEKVDYSEFIATVSFPFEI